MLPAHVLTQIGRLTPAEGERLAAIIGECSAAVEEAHKVNIGDAPRESWPPIMKKLRALLAQMASLVEVPFSVARIAEDGPEGSGAGMHREPGIWRDYATRRNDQARNVLACLGRATSEHGVPRDGPHSPDLFVWNRVAHSFGRRGLQYRLLTALWGREWVEDGSLLEAVYRDDEKENALRKLTLDLTETLAGWGVPWEVERVHGQGYALRQYPTLQSARK
jgi:hypothetical protein